MQRVKKVYCVNSIHYNVVRYPVKLVKYVIMHILAVHDVRHSKPRQTLGNLFWMHQKTDLVLFDVFVI